MKLWKVYNIIGSFVGSVEKVPVMKRTLRNICGKVSRESHVEDIHASFKPNAYFSQAVHEVNYSLTMSVRKVTRRRGR